MAKAVMPEDLNYCLSLQDDGTASLAIYERSALDLRVLIERASFFRPIIDSSHWQGQGQREVPRTETVYRQVGVCGVARSEEGALVLSLGDKDYCPSQLAWIAETLTATYATQERSEAHLLPV